MTRAEDAASGAGGLAHGPEDPGRRPRSQASAALAHAFGARLKRLRLHRRLTLQELGTAVDLSQSFLSMLERGQADVSLARAHRLAAFFEVALSELLIEDREGAQPRVIGVNEGDLVERAPGMTLRLLPIGRSLGLQVAHVRFQPRTARTTPVSHDGEDFFWVLSGTIVLTYGADEYVLRKGQSVLYSARVHHGFSNPAGKAAEMLSVTSPPYSGIAVPAAPEPIL